MPNAAPPAPAEATPPPPTRVASAATLAEMEESLIPGDPVDGYRLARAIRYATKVTPKEDGLVVFTHLEGPLPLVSGHDQRRAHTAFFGAKSAFHLHAAVPRDEALALADLLDGLSNPRRAHENLQARLRMAVLTAYVNRNGGLLLNASNKTELALGYGTLWGDLAGLLAPIGDLPKTEVVRLARWVAQTRGAIPPFVLERAPTAELAEGQVDPFDYEDVAPRVERLLASGGGGDDALRAAVRRAEGKRVVHGIVLKVTRTSFGSGRLVPVTRAY